MPRFMDHHADLLLAPQVIDELTDATREGRADRFGVRPVEAFHHAEGRLSCLLEAPDEAAVRRHHEARGVGCGEVHEVRSLL